MTRAQAWQAINIPGGVVLHIAGNGLTAGARGTLVWFGVKRCTVAFADRAGLELSLAEVDAAADLKARRARLWTVAP
jgi:hypothetical protein